METRRYNPDAVVNGATITIGQVETEMNRLKRRDHLSSRKRIEHLTPANMRVLARDMLIDEYLALQAAAEAGIRVTTTEVEAAFQGLIELTGPTKSINDILLEQGLVDENLLSQGLKNLYIDKVRKLHSTSLPPPSEEELRNFYEANRQVFESTPERVFARHIFLFIPQEDASSMEKLDAIRKRAEDLIVRLKEGEKFETLANRYTEDTRGIGTGGAIGWVLPGLGDRILEKVIFELEPGQIPDEPVRLLEGLSVPVIDFREEAVVPPFEEVRDRVLKGWQIEKFKEWLAERRRNAKIEFYEDLPQQDIVDGKRPQKIYR